MDIWLHALDAGLRTSNHQQSPIYFFESQTDNLHFTGGVALPPELELPPVHMTFGPTLSFPHVGDVGES